MPSRLIEICEQWTISCIADFNQITYLACFSVFCDGMIDFLAAAKTETQKLNLKMKALAEKKEKKIVLPLCLIRAVIIFFLYFLAENHLPLRHFR